ncbi:MAG: flagellin, partial [Alphaproteobacteria bacterium]|nr:flagellin [Alphaproteobacteria bacterium]
MVFVSTNGGALTARYHARLTGANSSKAVQMLASGARINGAGDDAAGLAVASKMKSQLRGLHAAMLNTSQGISLLQTAAEGMQTAEKLVQRIRELAVQSHNGTYTDNDRMNLQFEADSLLNQLTQNVEGTKFNDINLIDGSYERFMRVGNANSDVVRVAIDGVGIKTSIKGDSLASGTSTKVLVPSSQSSGTSSVNFPQTSFAASGTSELIYKATSTASGVSVDGSDNTPALLASTEVSVAASSHASGTTSVVVPATAATTGTSIPDRQNPTDAVISEASQFVAQGFQNGDFSATNFTQQTTPEGHIISLEGWDVHLKTVELDGDPFQIGDFQVPFDNTRDSRAVERSYQPFRPNEPNLIEDKLQNATRGAHWDVQNGELLLSHDGNINGYKFALTRGPYVISTADVNLETGDDVSFEWFGEAGGDAFDAYGYLLNMADGSTVELLNVTGVTPAKTESGKSTLELLNEGHAWTNGRQISADGWVSVNSVVPQDGNYRFVFIAGSFDGTGGRIHGNGLSIRNVDVTKVNGLGPNETLGIASVEVRQSDDVRIDSGLLASMQNVVSSDPGGSFSLLTDTADHTQFTADPVTGNIRANQPLLINSQEVYTLNLRYDGPNGFQHTETITITLT